MAGKKNVLAIIGSASENSANLKLVEHIGVLAAKDFKLSIYNELKSLPHFDPELSAMNPPKQIVKFRVFIPAKLTPIPGILTPL